MRYETWLKEVRRRLTIAGEPDPDDLIRKAGRDLPSLYIAGEPAITAARRLHRWRANPVPDSIVWLGTLASIIGVAVLFWPRKAKAKTSSTTQPPGTEEPSTSGPLPPAPTPIPEPPKLDCAGKVVVQYKISNTPEPQIRVFRRLLVWDKGAPQNREAVTDSTLVPISSPDLFSLNTTMSDFENRLLEAGASSSTRFYAEAWVETSGGGWCLQQFSTNYEPWL